MTNKTIVLGFPRSGTRSMANILNLGHEYTNNNGISDWKLVFKYKKSDGDYVIHVIRNPMDVIASNLFTMGYGSLGIIRENADIEDKSILSTIVEGFIKWTEEIERIKPDEVVRIEDKQIRINRRIHPDLKWNDLIGLPVELLNRIKEIAIKYGYDTND